MTAEQIEETRNAGGAVVRVRLIDGSLECVTVTGVTRSSIHLYGAVLGNKYAEIEFATARPTGWADNLSDEAIAGLLHLVRSLNLDLYHAWVQRRNEVRAKYGKLIGASWEHLFRRGLAS